jgi:hypothetical protein
MKNHPKKGVESQGDSATTNTASETSTGAAAPAATATGLMSVPVTQAADKKGNGTAYMVWPKKDLEGKSSLMAGKEGDKVVNKGDIVKDPETGQDIYLIRVHRGKRVWYAKGMIETQVQPEAQTVTE